MATVVAATSGVYNDAGLNVLGYDLPQGDDGEWRISEIDAGHIGGVFRIIKYLGVDGITYHFVNWLQECHVRRGGSPCGDTRLADTVQPGAHPRRNGQRIDGM